MAIQNVSNFLFISSFGKITAEAWSPARLNVFVPDIQAITFPAMSSERVAVGMCFLPWKTKSEWISSDTSNTSFSIQIRAILFSSSLVHTIPSGLWGLHRRNILACFAFSSKSSKSMDQDPSFSTIWFSSTFRPQASVTS